MSKLEAMNANHARLGPSEQSGAVGRDVAADDACAVHVLPRYLVGTETMPTIDELGD